MTAPPPEKLKVFISWSGPLAKQVTLILRQWLPIMLDGIEPWMSDVDIEAGARGLEEIATELDATYFGIIVVTRENQNAPWLNFEAGALSKRFGQHRSRVAPMLVDMTSAAQVTSPIKQFQCNVLNKEGAAKLLRALTTAAGSDWSSVEPRLEWSWPQTEARIEEVKATAGGTTKPPTRAAEDMLEELLGLVRPFSAQLRRLRMNSARDDFNRTVRRLQQRLAEIDTDPLEDEDRDYIDRWRQSPEFNEVVAAAKAKFDESWDFYNTVSGLTTWFKFVDALANDRIHPVDIARLAELYRMSETPLEDVKGMRHIALRHAEVLRELITINASSQNDEADDADVTA